MANSSKRKGDRAELEVQALLRDHLGVPARRKLGAGRKDDIGDIDGVPNTVVQVADYKDIARAVREKPLEAEQQRIRTEGIGWELPNGKVIRDDALPFAATFLRLRGGDYRVVMTVDQFCALWREAQ